MISLEGDGVCRYLTQTEYSPVIEADLQTVTFSTCPSGYYKMEGMLTCLKCPAGHRCINNTQPAVTCEPGKYQPEDGQTACLNCPLGTYSFFAET
jgi:hypothetical protein